METVKGLRDEARRCLEARETAEDPEERRRLAARALDLAQRAEMLERGLRREQESELGR
jgi:hypothetical protein